jgi:hypothetical protein
MLPVLTIFIVFLVVLTYHIKKSESAQAKVEEEFWEKEHRSNAVRKQDISKLDYITIPLEKIPYRLHTETEEQFWALADKTMVNLTGISNTDLKLTYGTANLALLSEYDANFSDMVSLLPQYALELSEAGETETAKMLLEFGVEHNADSSKIFLQLADIYRMEGNAAKLEALRQASDNLPQYTRMAVQKELH